MVHRAPILNGSALAFLLTDNRKSERLCVMKKVQLLEIRSKVMLLNGWSLEFGWRRRFSRKLMKPCKCMFLISGDALRSFGMRGGAFV